MTHRRFALTPLSAALLLLGSTAALAQSGTPAPAPAAAAASAPAQAAKADDKAPALQTVVVTAEHRSANIEKTAISMQVVSGSDIAEQGLSSGADILKNVSNVEIQGAARGNIVAIRGLGSDMPPGMGESAVSTNYDSVYNFLFENADLGFFDLDRVEVLRGPQGTLYGRNAAAGAVNFITRDPVIGSHAGDASLEFGSYDLVRGEFGVNVPVNDQFALRVSGAAITRNGYLTDGYDDAKASGARVKALYKPNEDLRILLGFEKTHDGGKGIGFIADANWNDASTRLTAARHQDADGNDDGQEKVGYQSYDENKVWAQVDANLGFGTLTVIPAYQRSTGEVYRKWDASHQGAENWSFDPNPATQKSLETRLASNAGSALQWVAGVYYYDMHNLQTCILNCRAAEVLDTTNSKAAFAQATYALSPTTRFIAGIRQTADKKTNTTSLAGAKWNNTDGKLGLEYDVAPDVMSYATVATAYRPGGFNTFNAANPAFGPEHLLSYELGLKGRFLDNRLQFDTALFQMNYRGYQAIDNYINPAATSTSDPNYVLSAVYNVPHQVIRGLEASAHAVLPTDTLLNANVTWLDAKLGDLVLHDFATGEAYSMAGAPLPHAPRFSFKGGVEQPVPVFDGALTLRADVRYTAQQYISISEAADSHQPGYTQGDLSMQYRPDTDQWGFNVYVKNVTNYVPKTGEFGGYLSVGAPRTWGVVLTTRWR